MEITLTPRQARTILDNARFQVTVAGRRGGKTFGTGVRILQEATKPGSMIGYMAPNRRMAKRLMWQWLERYTPPEWIKGKPNQSDLIMTLVNGSVIALYSGEAFEAARGEGFNHFEFDEMQGIPREAWTEVIRPALSDRRGSAGFRGTPKGRANVLFDLFQQGQSSPGWSTHTYTTLEGGLVHPEEIELARAELDERTFQQEYEASFVTSGGLVYYAFDRAINVHKTPVELNPNERLILTWDFNATEIKPMCCFALQGTPERYTVIHGFVYRNSNTEETAKAVRAWLDGAGFHGPIDITGDHAGKRSESNASLSDYEIIRNFFPNARIKTTPVRNIRDRVNATNSLLRSADGTHRLFFNPPSVPGMRDLIEDIERVEWKDSGQGLNDAGGQRTDETDALSYMPYNFHPVHIRQPKVTRH